MRSSGILCACLGMTLLWDTYICHTTSEDRVRCGVVCSLLGKTILLKTDVTSIFRKAGHTLRDTCTFLSVSPPDETYKSHAVSKRGLTRRRSCRVSGTPSFSGRRTQQGVVLYELSNSRLCTDATSLSDGHNTDTVSEVSLKYRVSRNILSVSSLRNGHSRYTLYKAGWEYGVSCNS